MAGREAATSEAVVATTATVTGTRGGPSKAQLDTLLQWFQDNSGFLNPGIDLAYEANGDAGVHFYATADLGADTRICTIPHAMALSSLNALVDDSFPVFKNRGLAVEAIGYFYLLHQYLHREQSFWKPYLDTLPGPDIEHRTPFWFKDDDLTWLEDTDVLYTTKARQEIYRTHYQHGITLLAAAGIDIAPYTWHLFLRAITIFTSRSFSSQAIRPHDSKYWSAYKTGPEGRRQVVLMNMSHISADDLDFPVLFPVLDIPNHAPAAQVSWAFDPGFFSMTIKQDVAMTSHVFNNYGPKRNDELLLGYGFCLADNPHERVLLTLKAPPLSIQDDIRRVQPGYFGQDGEWDSERATFGISPLYPEFAPEAIFRQLPEPLLELLIYMLRHERQLPFSFVQDPTEFLTAENSIGRQYLPHITRMVVQSLLPKMAKMQASTPLHAPRNARQLQAKIYRDGQLRILQSITGGLRSYLRSLMFPPQLQTGPRVLTIEGLFEVLKLRAGAQHAKDFLTGVAANAGTMDLEQIREAGWEDEVLVLLICFVYSLCGMSSVLPDYLSLGSEVEPDVGDEELEQARSVLELVRVAFNSCPESFWGDSRWSESFIASLGGRIVKYESFVMMVPTGDAEGGDARLVVYVHG